MVRLSGTACPLNCGKQNHLNLFEKVVAISLTESIKRTRHLCKAEFLYFLYFYYLNFQIMFIQIKVDCNFLLLLFYLIDLPCLNKNKVQVQVQVQILFQSFINLQNLLTQSQAPTTNNRTLCSSIQSKTIVAAFTLYTMQVFKRTLIQMMFFVLCLGRMFVFLNSCSEPWQLKRKHLERLVQRCYNYSQLFCLQRYCEVFK